MSRVDRSKLGDWLEHLGFKYPQHERPGYKYTNIHGNYAEIEYEKPIMLVRYIPTPVEEFYKDEAEAVANIPKDDNVIWQILHGITGEVLREPRRITGRSSVDSRHRHTWYMDKNGNGKMSDVMGHIHDIKNFNVTTDNDHDHDLFFKRFKYMKKRFT